MGTARPSTFPKLRLGRLKISIAINIFSLTLLAIAKVDSQPPHAKLSSIHGHLSDFSMT